MKLIPYHVSLCTRIDQSLIQLIQRLDFTVYVHASALQFGHLLVQQPTCGIYDHLVSSSEIVQLLAKIIVQLLLRESSLHPLSVPPDELSIGPVQDAHVHHVSQIDVQYMSQHDEALSETLEHTHCCHLRQLIAHKVCDLLVAAQPKLASEVVRQLAGLHKLPEQPCLSDLFVFIVCTTRLLRLDKEEEVREIPRNWTTNDRDHLWLPYR
mmetsp:Transcript_12059/g.36753  ORF Transcript_12059/g.36753 Transcript_12059/m.36753 type:complete len:210 (-) Transcript_12059:725-1354(-)